MTPAIVHCLQKRPFRLDGAETLSAHGSWYGGNPFTTQVLNAYTILVPGGERFIIRTSRKCLGQIGPALKDEVERVFFQEGAHSREHERVLKAMRVDGLSLDVFRKLVEWFSYSLI